MIVASCDICGAVTDSTEQDLYGGTLFIRQQHHMPTPFGTHQPSHDVHHLCPGCVRQLLGIMRMAREGRVGP